jgi:hypothetical protein
MCEEPQPVRVYVVDGPGGVHYVRQDGDIVTADVEGVLDGDLDDLLTKRLRQRAEGRA